MLYLTGALEAQKGELYALHWKIAGSIPASPGQLKSLGLAGCVVGKSNQFLVVAGGSNFPDSMPWLGGKKKYYDDVFVFNFNKGQFQFYAQSKLPFNVGYAASCSTNSGVLFAGGENENGISKKVWILQWNEKNKNISLHSLPDLPEPITNASIVVNDHKVYVAGGEKIRGVSKDLLVLDLDNVSNGWEVLSSLPYPVSHSIMLLQSDGKNHCIFLVGGRMKRIDSASVLHAGNWKFDLHTNKWTENRSLPYALSAGTGISFGANCLLIIGGDKGKTFHDTEQLIIAIQNEKDELRKQKLNEEKIHLQSSHPGFSNHALFYNTVTDNWATLDSIPFATPVTTTAVKWGNAIVIPGGEIKAGVRSASILVGEFVSHHK